MTDSLLTEKEAVFSAQQKNDVGDRIATDSACDYLAHKAALAGDTNLAAIKANGDTSVTLESSIFAAIGTINTNTFHTIDTDSTTTAGTTYIKCSDGRIRKVVTTSDATGAFYGGYIAAVGSTWINRVTATYTKE